MIIPSIDIMDGQAVQLIGGETKALEAGDPMAIAARFARTGPIAVIDLDAALGTGDNSALIRSLCAIYRCRVGGGIRSVERARAWLDAGAEHVLVGTAASPEFFAQLPRDRCLAALDVRGERVVVDGWRRQTEHGVEEQMAALNPYVDGYLVTFVEREGRMGGTRLDRVPALVRAAQGARVTIAGGVTTAAEIAKLDDLGADAQLGMALYTGRLSLAEALTAPMRSDRPDGLWPTVVVDQHQRALGLVYSNLRSVAQCVETGEGTYWSRRRGLWRKGEGSGATQEVVRVDLDCDRDSLRVTVRQRGAGFCHRQTNSCWGALDGLPRLAERLSSRLTEAPTGSYTKRLFEDPVLLRSKLIEEVHELSDAMTPAEAVWETADVLYFALVAMTARGAQWGDVVTTLERRAQSVSRRSGDAKEPEVRHD